MTDTATTPRSPIPAAGQARSRLRRASGETPTWRVRVARWYERAVYLVVIGGVVFGLVTYGLDRPAAEHRWAGNGAGWTLVCLSVVAAAILVKVLAALGPLVVAPSRVHWLISSPVDRASLLLPRFLVLLATGSLIGAAWLAVAIGVLGPAVGPSPPLFPVAAAVGVALCAGATALQRTSARSDRMRTWSDAVSVVAVSALLLGLFVPSGVSWATLDAGLLMTIAVLVATAAVAAGLNALGRIDRASLSAGSALATAVAVSVTWLDPGILSGILLERRARLLGRVRSVRLRGPRVVLIVWSDLLRVIRSGNALLVWLALIPVPIIVGVSGAGGLVPAVHLVAAFLATHRLGGGLRFVSGSPAMRRVLGLPDRVLRLAHTVLPAIGAVSWCVITVLITTQVSPVHGLVSAVGAVAVTYRLATRPPLDYDVPIVDVGLFGPAPVGLILQLGRGIGLLLLLAVVQTVLL